MREKYRVIEGFNQINPLEGAILSSYFAIQLAAIVIRLAVIFVTCFPIKNLPTQSTHLLSAEAPSLGHQHKMRANCDSTL